MDEDDSDDLDENKWTERLQLSTKQWDGYTFEKIVAEFSSSEQRLSLEDFKAAFQALDIPQEVLRKGWDEKEQDWTSRKRGIQNWFKLFDVDQDGFVGADDLSKTFDRSGPSSPDLSL